MHEWFTGYALLFPVFIANAVALALFAVPCAIASRFSRKAGTFVWLTTLALLFFGVVTCICLLKVPPRDSWRIGLPLALIVMGPQALAYPVGRNRPLMVIGAAIGFGIALAFAWLVLGGLSGSTPD
jgi:hypothetical protein